MHHVIYKYLSIMKSKSVQVQASVTAEHLLMHNLAEWVEQPLTCGLRMAESTGGLGTLTSRYSCPMMVLDL